MKRPSLLTAYRIICAAATAIWLIAFLFTGYVGLLGCAALSAGAAALSWNWTRTDDDHIYTFKSGGSHSVVSGIEGEPIIPPVGTFLGVVTGKATEEPIYQYPEGPKGEWHWSELEYEDGSTIAWRMVLGFGLELFVSQGGWWWIHLDGNQVAEWRGDPSGFSDPVTRAKEEALNWARDRYETWARYASPSPATGLARPPRARRDEETSLGWVWVADFLRFRLGNHLEIDVERDGGWAIFHAGNLVLCDGPDPDPESVEEVDRIRIGKLDALDDLDAQLKEWQMASACARVGLEEYAVEEDAK